MTTDVAEARRRDPNPRLDPPPYPIYPPTLALTRLSTSSLTLTLTLTLTLALTLTLTRTRTLTLTLTLALTLSLSLPLAETPTPSRHAQALRDGGVSSPPILFTRYPYPMHPPTRRCVTRRSPASSSPRPRRTTRPSCAPRSPRVRPRSLG